MAHEWFSVAERGLVSRAVFGKRSSVESTWLAYQTCNPTKHFGINMIGAR